MTDLERRVARLEAREQIRELVAEYSMAVDDRDIPTIARLFATDAVFGDADGTLTVEGRDAIAEFYTTRLGSMGPTFHFPHSHRIDFVDDDNATGVARPRRAGLWRQHHLHRAPVPRSVRVPR